MEALTQTFTDAIIVFDRYELFCCYQCKKGDTVIMMHEEIAGRTSY
jgi:hypothetical protein